jgi:hypothetical protein
VRDNETNKVTNVAEYEKKDEPKRKAFGGMYPEIEDDLREDGVDASECGEETKIDTDLFAGGFDTLAESHFHPANVIAGAVRHWRWSGSSQFWDRHF